MGGRRRPPGRVLTRRRRNKQGIVRVTYTALYWDSEREVSAGTFDDPDEAEAAWLAKASQVRRGTTMIDPAKSRMLFEDFAEIFRMTRFVERAKTGMDQDSALRAQLLPVFGKFQLREIDTAAVQAWMKSMEGTHTANTRRSYLGILSGILTMAVQFQYIERHPVPGVKVPKDKKTHSNVLERMDFDRVRSVLPGDTSRFFVWLAVNSGCRFGELTELRVSDVHSMDEGLPEEEIPDEEMVYLHVQRNVSDVGQELGDDGGRFKVEDTTKNGEDRTVTLDQVTTKMLLDHIEKHGLKGNDLIFPLRLFMDELVAVEEVLPIVGDLGYTEPNEKGKVYRHGTATAYGMGKCRCEHCKRAVAEYRAERRAKGMDRKPRNGKRGVNISGHLPRDTHRNLFWIPALDGAKVARVRFHDLRHTHATWLARRGVDIIELQERMGHKRLSTTQIYIKKNTRPTVGAANLIGKIMQEPARERRLRRVLAAAS